MKALRHEKMTGQEEAVAAAAEEEDDIGNAVDQSMRGHETERHGSGLSGANDDALDIGKDTMSKAADASFAWS
ncbi:unnamed protein product [Tilletia controversa]|nr:unnamed protein product [Tilletia controversa]CAD6981946.1 unnamed protein product [Tilletia controversa]CAD7061715.1 unnamed protein product [Tilletia caries]